MKRLATIIGAFTGLATITGVVFAFWQWWDAPKANLRASISVNEFLLPPDAAADVVQARKLRSSKDFTRLLQEKGLLDGGKGLGGSSSAPTDKSDGKEVQPGLAELYSQPFTPFRDSSSMVKVVVENTGNAPSRNVVLRLPGKAGKILVKKEDGTLASFNNEQTLKLGDLRKAEKATVWYWDDYFSRSYVYKDIESSLLVTDDAATGSVTVVAPGGYDDYQRQSFIEKVLFSLISVLFAGFLISAVVAIFKTQRNLSSKRKEDSRGGE